MREPDFVIGDPSEPYIRRWYVIPRNRWFNIYLHQILHSDDDRALHDHPWWNVSIILKGSYLEVTGAGKRLMRRRGNVVFRLAKTAHRLEVRDHSSCWSLFLTGSATRIWGFHCPKGWIPWTEFTAPGAKGQIGAGCGE